MEEMEASIARIEKKVDGINIKRKVNTENICCITKKLLFSLETVTRSRHYSRALKH